MCHFVNLCSLRFLDCGHILTKVCCRVNFSNTWSSTCTAHCAGSRWRSQWNEKKYHISALLESQWPRWLWLAMSLCSGAIWPRWRSVAFVAQFFHIANLSRLRTSESEPRRQSEHSDLELRWCLCLLRCNDQLKRVWNCRLLWYAAKLARSSTEESSGSYACWYFQALLKNLDWRKVDIGRKTRAAHRNEMKYNITNCSPFQGSSPCRCPAICKGRDMHLGAIKVKVSPNQKWNF